MDLWSYLSLNKMITNPNQLILPLSIQLTLQKSVKEWAASRDQITTKCSHLQTRTSSSQTILLRLLLKKCKLCLQQWHLRTCLHLSLLHRPSLVLAEKLS